MLKISKVKIRNRTDFRVLIPGPPYADQIDDFGILDELKVIGPSPKKKGPSSPKGIKSKKKPITPAGKLADLVGYEVFPFRDFTFTFTIESLPNNLIMVGHNDFDKRGFFYDWLHELGKNQLLKNRVLWVFSCPMLDENGDSGPHEDQISEFIGDYGLLGFLVFGENIRVLDVEKKMLRMLEEIIYLENKRIETKAAAFFNRTKESFPK